MEHFRILIQKALQPLLGMELKLTDLETPPDRARGDLAFPCFRLSKLLGKAPPVIATDLAGTLAPALLASGIQVEAAGPYLNFRIKAQALIEHVLVPLVKAGTNFGSSAKDSREKWVFEYSSPNVAKPFQIYHLRTTIVGATLARIARHRGFQVTTINHLGDWGTQYGKLAIALKRYESELPKDITLKTLVDIYVRIHKDMETDPTIETASQDAFRKLEAGDPEMRKIWKMCVDISLKEFQKTYDRYQVTFDHFWGESHYEDQLKPLLSRLKSEGILVEDQGAQVVHVTSRDGKEIPPCILEKSDGASIYATRDVAAALYRYEKFHFDRMSYIVGKEQKLHFEQVFGTLRAMKLDWEPRCEHIATGLYRFKDAKMSTRKGNFITLEEVNDLCTAKSLELMRARNASEDTREEARLSDAEINTISEQVAIGALVFADLSTDPSKDLEFDVDRVISFEGETGPYLQYAHTRCLSILRRAKAAGFSATSADTKELMETLVKPEESALIGTLARFSEALERTLDQRKPSQLASYLIDVTKDFGHFYRECKVMNPENPALTRARLALVEASRNVLSLGLDLLGMPKPEKM
ncbi:MAG: arginine--tRNA ligase [Bdellovibrionales bacterium]|nr:arginine--tRNA ligase [Bdellovibrionales bacterium]